SLSSVPRLSPILSRFKKSGEFDKLRRELLAESQRSELMQEVNRFPVVERFVSEVPMLKDNAFKDGIHSSLQRILREDRGHKDPPPAQASAPSQPPADSTSPKEEEEAPVLPPQEALMVPLVSRGSPSEAGLGGKQTDAIDPAPLTTAQETGMNSPVPPPPAPSS
ncbi:hypothetical protein DFH09DRAFT_1156340, partial [Mycena vulgaris]